MIAAIPAFAAGCRMLRDWKGDHAMRKHLLTLACAALLAAPASAVTIDWVTVGDPGNVADTEVMACCGSSTGTTGYGAVAGAYLISKYETTNAQYAEFLNAVAATDTNALYHWHMGRGLGGITRSGSSGSFSYGTRAGREAMPVNYVSFYDALRFANWLHNGQPMGPQGNATTEDGAYTITALGIANNSITRNAGATIFLPSEDEWYKAAYYDADSTSYFDYPAGTDTQTVCAAPRATANTANCNFIVVGDLTDVGSYTGSASPNGTFDQGGNVMEWNEAIISGSSRGNRGGGWTFNPFSLRAAFGNRTNPTFELHDFGFRVASTPSPAWIAAVRLRCRTGSGLPTTSSMTCWSRV
jgi:hypothetical protein